MAKKENPSQRSVKQETKTVPSDGILARLEQWFAKHDKKVFYSLLFLSTLFSLLLFDSKVSEGGDDSGYIERAWSLLHEGKFPYYQGPGYPIMLTLIVKIFGLNVIALKLASVFFQLGFVWFTYKAFHKRIPFTVLFALISFISLNLFIQYYSSQTFTETFFLFLQSIALYVTFRIIDAINKNDTWIGVVKKNYLKWLAFGFMFVMLSISKSIAIVCIAGVVLYFLLNKNYKQAVYAILFFAVIRIVYTLIVTAAFGPSDSDQFEMILRKQLYKPAAGHEDVAGLISRFFSNCKTYLSVHIYRILRNAPDSVLDAAKINSALAWFTSIIIGLFAVISYRKNKYIFFAAIYFIVLCCGIFVGIQAANMQDRLIIIAMPLIFLVLFYGAYVISGYFSASQYLFIGFTFIMFLWTLKGTTTEAVKNIPALKKNLSGDIYYGYTPDWENFLKMSKYCADSLPDSAQVLSRKPNMSFIYGNGKKFVGQYWVTTTNPDSVQMEWKSKDIQYIILPSIRMNPRKNNGKIINTVHRMLVPFYNKYPHKVKLVKTIGTKEKCELFEITY
jgi:hypothetical protein